MPVRPARTAASRPPGTPSRATPPWPGNTARRSPRRRPTPAAPPLVGAASPSTGRSWAALCGGDDAVDGVADPVGGLVGVGPAGVEPGADRGDGNGRHEG